jgi:hypothetical protein
MRRSEIEIKVLNACRSKNCSSIRHAYPVAADELVCYLIGGSTFSTRWRGSSWTMRIIDEDKLLKRSFKGTEQVAGDSVRAGQNEGWKLAITRR